MKKDPAKSKPTGHQRKLLKMNQEVLFQAVIKGDIERVRTSILEGVSPRFKMKKRTPLHDVVYNDGPCTIEMIDLLLDAGAAINAKGMSNWTPLHWACHNKDLSLSAAHLIARGADIHAVNVDLDTPLHRAASSSALKCIHVLLGAGADMMRLNAKGESARAIAKTDPLVDAVFRAWLARKAAHAAASELTETKPMDVSSNPSRLR